MSPRLPCLLALLAISLTCLLLLPEGTWLQEKSHVNMYQVETYEMVRQDRPVSQTSEDKGRSRIMWKAEEYFVPYSPPSWTSRLPAALSEKLTLAILPTPIHRWYLPGVPEGFEVYIKRDDMTGSTLSGSKVRKLEFLLADAIRKGCRHVITSGRLQSNQARAVAIAAAQLGLQAHLIIKTDITSASDIDGAGNVLLEQLSGAKLYLVTPGSNTHITAYMEALSKAIREKTGETSYQLPNYVDTIGIWGYMDGFSELLHQGVADKFDDVAVACAGGGTLEGLAIGNYLSRSELRIHGLEVSTSSEDFHAYLQDTLQYFSLDGETKAEDMLNIVHKANGLGYGLSTQEELAFIARVMQTTGIALDPFYTGRAVMALVRELNHNPQSFKGKRILYIHTGGVFGMYDGRLAKMLGKDADALGNIYTWPDVSDACPI